MYRPASKVAEETGNGDAVRRAWPPPADRHAPPPSGGADVVAEMGREVVVQRWGRSASCMLLVPFGAVFFSDIRGFSPGPLPRTAPVCGDTPHLLATRTPTDQHQQRGPRNDE